jgi:hypothetical protein
MDECLDPPANGDPSFPADLNAGAAWLFQDRTVARRVESDASHRHCRWVVHRFELCIPQMITHRTRTGHAASPMHRAWCGRVPARTREAPTVYP